ncbi:AIR synthase-related protein [Pantoea cypripedii]|uniref:AIR synthase-related protein n=1 Tax=Pantoea cypripedii TaxID=55209 RepID=UPI002FC61FB3
MSDSDQKQYPQYIANITGHGWQKVMRSPNALTYIIDNLPSVPLEMKLISEKAQLSVEEAYKTFNMGAGFALFVAEESVEAILALAEGQPFTALHAGYVENGEKKVVISPLNITYHGDEFKLRS